MPELILCYIIVIMFNKIDKASLTIFEVLYYNSFLILLQVLIMQSMMRFLIVAGIAAFITHTARGQTDLDTLIDQVFGNGDNKNNNNNNSNNQQPPVNQNQERVDGGNSNNPLQCQCVPYYLCKNNQIITDGVGLIDIRSGFLTSNQPCSCPASNTRGWVRVSPVYTNYANFQSMGFLHVPHVYTNLLTK